MNQFIKEIQEQPEMLERTLGYYHSREGKERLDAVWCLVIIRIGRNYFTAGFLVWWRIGGELIGNMVIILRLYWSVRRGIASQHSVVLFCRRSCVSAIRTVLILKVNRRRNAIWDVFF